jgi:hypothetical protein
MKRLSLYVAALGLASALFAGRAEAFQKNIGGGYGLFLEPALGFLVPVAEDDYEDALDPSFKLAFLHFGYTFNLGPVYLGPELSADFTPYSDDVPGDYDFYRMRMMGFLRLVIPIPPHPRLRILVRAGTGLGVTWGERRGADIDDELGVVFDIVGGIEYQVHRRITVGMTMGFPFGIYPEDEDLFTFDIDFLWHATFYLWP